MYYNGNNHPMFPNDPYQNNYGNGNMYQNGYNGYNQGCNGYGGRRAVTKKMLLDTIVSFYGACDVVQVDEFETDYTRHICQGGNKIQILNVIHFNIPTEMGPVVANIFYCPNCRKLIIDKSSLEIM